ncbi:MAG: hypothetical protein HYU53_01995 [Acidobacteria bacterium]|nr:hypothetical protein [Acidobacteriota bacterium]
MLTSRFMSGVIACVLVSAVAVGWRLHTYNKSRAIEDFQEHQLHTADVVAATLRAELTGAARTLRALSGAIARQPDVASVRAMLDEQVRCTEPPCFVGIAFYGADGRLAYAAGRSPGLSSPEIDAQARWAGDPANAGRMQTAVSSAVTPSLVFATPVREPAAGPHGGPGGVLAAESELDSLLSGSGATLDDPSVAGLILDGRGNVVFRTAHPEMRLRNIKRRTPLCRTCHQSFDHVERMFEMPRGAIRYSLRGAQHLGAVAPFDFEGERWVAALMAPADSVVRVLGAEFRQLAALMAATLLALGLVMQVTWAQRRRRIQAEAEAARREHLERSHAELTALNARLESAAVEWRTTVDTIDAALMVLDPFGKIARMNRVASDTLPGEPFSWLGLPSEELAFYPPWDSALALAREAVETQEASAARVHHAETGRTWDLWCRSPHGSGSVVVVARDTTSLVELQRSLRRSETMAALGSVVVGVAHEVRNPLFAMSSLVDAWSVQTNRDPSQFLDALRHEVGRVNTLMTELLEYGRPTKVVLQPSPLATVIQEAVRACSPEAEQHGVRVAAGPAPDLQVWMDSRRLVRVFINLIQNAIQHSPAGAAVSVAVALRPPARPRLVDITVRDRGRGFAAEDLPRVFAPFFSRRAGGFGLGLAISERIVAEHRGTAAAANHPEGGAIVTVSLPLTPPERQVRVAQGVTRVEEPYPAGR